MVSTASVLSPTLASNTGVSTASVLPLTLASDTGAPTTAIAVPGLQLGQGVSTIWQSTPGRIPSADDPTSVPNGYISMLSENALGRGNLACPPLVLLCGSSERSRKGLEGSLHNVVRVLPCQLPAHRPKQLHPTRVRFCFSCARARCSALPPRLLTTHPLRSFLGVSRQQHAIVLPWAHMQMMTQQLPPGIVGRRKYCHELGRCEVQRHA